MWIKNFRSETQIQILKNLKYLDCSKIAVSFPKTNVCYNNFYKYLQASLPFGRHPYCNTWWKHNLCSDQRGGPSLIGGPRWLQQIQRAAPTRLHTDPWGFFQQTPDGDKHKSLTGESHREKKKEKKKTCFNNIKIQFCSPQFQFLGVFLWTHCQEVDLHIFSAL